MKVGPYVYESQDDVVLRSFGAGRHLTFVRSVACDAGIVGTERNGIAILDDDNGDVVADLVGCGRREWQEKAFGFLRDASFREVQEFLAGSERRRPGIAADLASVGPEPLVFPPLGAMLRRGDVARTAGPSILDEQARRSNASDTSPYSFPEMDRLGMIAWLARHAVHRDGHGPSRLAWNVKIHSRIDGDATSGSTTAELDPFWEKVDGNEAFDHACTSATRRFVEGEYTSYPGDDQGDWKFAMEGRSGGWMVLESWRGRKFAAYDMSGLAASIDELSDEELAAFYRGVVCLDQDLSSPADDVEAELVALREAREEDWKAEPVEAVSWAVDKGVEAGKLLAAAAVLGVCREDFVAVLEEGGLELDGLDLDRLPSAAAPVA